MNAQALRTQLDITPKRRDKVALVSDILANKMADMQALMDCINKGPDCLHCIRSGYCERRKRNVP